MSEIISSEQIQILALQLATDFESLGISYCFIGETALLLQGLRLTRRASKSLQVAIQWDLFERAHDFFQADAVSDPIRNADFIELLLVRNHQPISLIAYFNTVVETDKHRISFTCEGKEIFLHSLYAYLGDVSWHTEIREYLDMLQQQNSKINEQAWSVNSYDAWINRHGTPQEAAQKLIKNPRLRLKTLLPLMGEVKGKKIINLLGSHGSKAVAFGLMDADVTVVDVSHDNAKYAGELAESAGVGLRYVVSDVLKLPVDEQTGDYDWVVMELGILHYFLDLQSLLQVVFALLKPGGRLILQDFHPISTKLISSRGKKHKVSGNYFDASLVQKEVAFSKYSSEMNSQHVILRQWTLGEIVTAVADAGLRICQLDEDPNHKLDDLGIPKTFTLVAGK